MKTPLSLPLLGIVFFTSSSFRISPFTYLRTVTRNTYFVLVEKRRYELHIFDSSGERIASYPVVFGSRDMGDKMMQGDKKTPEGIFHIILKRRHEKWNSFIGIDYPNEESYRKFNERKTRGLIPSGAQIGGGIGIHGTWPNEDFAIDRYDNWTEGCISTKNKYIREIFALLPVGTRVEIRG